MPGIRDDFAEGHAGLSPADFRPNLPDHLKALNMQRDGEIDWFGPVTVDTNVAVMPLAGPVFAVDATAASATGPKALRSEGVVAAGEVLVTYDPDGVATLTFEATDAVTAAKVMFLRRGKDLHDD